MQDRMFTLTSCLTELQNVICTLYPNKRNKQQTMKCSNSIAWNILRGKKDSPKKTCFLYSLTSNKVCLWEYEVFFFSTPYNLIIGKCCFLWRFSKAFLSITGSQWQHWSTNHYRILKNMHLIRLCFLSKYVKLYKLDSIGFNTSFYRFEITAKINKNKQR